MHVPGPTGWRPASVQLVCLSARRRTRPAWNVRDGRRIAHLGAPERRDAIALGVIAEASVVALALRLRERFGIARRVALAQVGLSEIPSLPLSWSPRKRAMSCWTSTASKTLRGPKHDGRKGQAAALCMR